jgi:hypothetical protein
MIKALVTLVTGGALFAGFSGRAVVLHNIAACTALCGYVTTRGFGFGLDRSVKKFDQLSAVSRFRPPLPWSG